VDGLALIDSLLSDSTGLDSASAARLWKEIEEDSAVTYDLPVEVNERVLLQLRLFQERLPQHFARWLERKGRWEAMITHELAAHGLPRDLLYLAMIESGFSPRATSTAAAAGIWQFIRPPDGGSGCGSIVMSTSGATPGSRRRQPSAI
jgi:hypothetical protein